MMNLSRILVTGIEKISTFIGDFSRIPVSKTPRIQPIPDTFEISLFGSSSGVFDAYPLVGRRDEASLARARKLIEPSSPFEKLRVKWALYRAGIPLFQPRQYSSHFQDIVVSLLENKDDELAFGYLVLACDYLEKLSDSAGKKLLSESLSSLLDNPVVNRHNDMKASIMNTIVRVHLLNGQGIEAADFILKRIYPLSLEDDMMSMVFGSSTDLLRKALVLYTKADHIVGRITVLKLLAEAATPDDAIIYYEQIIDLACANTAYNTDCTEALNKLNSLYLKYKPGYYANYLSRAARAYRMIGNVSCLITVLETSIDLGIKNEDLYKVLANYEVLIEAYITVGFLNEARESINKMNHVRQRHKGAYDLNRMEILLFKLIIKAVESRQIFLAEQACNALIELTPKSETKILLYNKLFEILFLSGSPDFDKVMKYLSAAINEAKAKPILGHDTIFKAFVFALKQVTHIADYELLVTRLESDIQQMSGYGFLNLCQLYQVIIGKLIEFSGSNKKINTLLRALVKLIVHSADGVTHKNEIERINHIIDSVRQISPQDAFLLTLKQADKEMAFGRSNLANLYYKRAYEWAGSQADKVKVATHYVKNYKRLDDTTSLKLLLIYFLNNLEQNLLQVFKCGLFIAHRYWKAGKFKQSFQVFNLAVDHGFKNGFYDKVSLSIKDFLTESANNELIELPKNELLKLAFLRLKAGARLSYGSQEEVKNDLCDWFRGALHYMSETITREGLSQAMSDLRDYKGEIANSHVSDNIEIILADIGEIGDIVDTGAPSLDEADLTNVGLAPFTLVGGLQSGLLPMGSR